MSARDSYIRFRIESELKELFFKTAADLDKVPTKIIRRQIIEWLKKNGVEYVEDLES